MGKGGGGIVGGILGAIAGVVLTIIFPPAGGVYWGTYLGAAGLGFGIGSIAGSLIVPPSVPNAPSNDSMQLAGDRRNPLAASNTYGWRGIRNSSDVGIPMPVIYGDVIFGGNLISVFTKAITTGDFFIKSHELYVLLALCEGLINSVSDVTLNDVSVDSYSNVSFDYRLGNDVQNSIDGFNEIGTLVTKQSHITDTPFVYVSSKAVDVLELLFVFPQGIFAQNNRGEISSTSISIKVEYKLSVDSVWTEWGVQTETDIIIFNKFIPRNFPNLYTVYDLGKSFVKPDSETIKVNDVAQSKGIEHDAETFPGSGWSENEPASTTIEQYSSWPGDGNNSIRIVGKSDGTDDASLSKTFTVGSGKNWEASATFRAISIEDGDFCRVVSVEDASGKILSAGMYRDGSQYKLSLLYYNGSSWSKTDGFVSVLDTTIYLRMFYDYSNNKVTVTQSEWPSERGVPPHINAVLNGVTMSPTKIYIGYPGSGAGDYGANSERYVDDIGFKHDSNYTINYNLGEFILVNGETSTQAVKATFDYYPTYFHKKKGKTHAILRIVFSDRDRYDVRVTRLTESSEIDNLLFSELYVTGINEILSDKLIYPRTALLAVNALATDQLSGVLPTIKSNVSGKADVLVPELEYPQGSGVIVDYDDCYHDGTNYRNIITDTIAYETGSYVRQYTKNPVWCLYDFVTNPFYGIGQDLDSSFELDFNSFVDESKYCYELSPNGIGGTERRFELDIAFDVNGAAWDLIQQICSTFKGNFVKGGSGYRVFVDKIDTAVQMFTVGNIVAGSFKLHYIPRTKYFNTIEAQYMLNGEREQNSITDETAFSNDEDVVKRTVSFYGVSRTSQIMRLCKGMLLSARLITQTIEFKTGMDSVVCQAGDVIKFQHRLPSWSGYGGRIVRLIKNDVVEIGESLTVEGGKTYQILVRHNDDTISTKTITNGVGSHTKIIVDSVFSPALSGDELYAVGEINLVTKDFRVAMINAQRDNTFQVTAIEYNEDVYDETINLDEFGTEIEENPNAIPPSVEDLEIKERLLKTASGDIVTEIDVYFSRPDYRWWGSGKVYYSINDGESWELAGQTSGNNFIITNVDTGDYIVAVTSVSTTGTEQLIVNAEQASLSVVGKAAPPEDVTGFDVKQQGQTLTMNWNPVSDVDLGGYEIRLGRSWAGGITLVTVVKSTSFILTSMTDGDYDFWIAAIDTSGNYSSSPALAEITVTGVNDELNTLINQEEVEDSPSGTFDQMMYVGDQGSETDSMVVQMHARMSDFDRAMNHSSFNNVTMEGLLTGNYITPKIDLGSIVNANTRVYVDSDGSDPGITMASFPANKKMSDFAPHETMDNINSSFTVLTEIRISDDDITWSDWEEYRRGKYSGRYIQFRVTITLITITSLFYLHSFNIIIDADGVDLVIANFSVSSGTGNDVLFSTYGKSFVSTPSFNATLLNASAIAVPVISSKTSTGFHIDVLDKNDNKVAGTCDIRATGY
jgi:predicted phage tail protein